MRRKKKEHRETIPDPIYNSVLVAKLTNRLMIGGKKNTAQKVIWDALEEIKKAKKNEDPVVVLEQAIKNITPLVEVRSRRVGGATYQVPREIPADRAFFLACRWLIGAARSKKGKPTSKKLAEEIFLAVKNEGAAIKKKLVTHRMAEANRAFAHFAW